MARSQRVLRRARQRYAEIYRGRSYRLGKATGIQYVLDQRPQPQFVKADEIIAHIHAEALVRGDFSQAILTELTDYIESFDGYARFSQWSSMLEHFAQARNDAELTRTSLALSHYLRRYGRGWTPSSVAIVARYANPAA